MDKLTVCRGNIESGFAINRVKVLYGRNYDAACDFMRSIENYALKVAVSEYNEESGGKLSICLNDHSLRRQEFICLRLDPYYQIDQEMRLGTQSLMRQYCEVLLEEAVYDDAFSTLSAVYGAVEEDLINERLRLQSDSINVHFGLEPLTVKLLEKHIEPKVIRNGYRANQSDISVRDSLTIQIEMMRRVIRKSLKTVFIIADFQNVYNYLLPLYEIAGIRSGVYILVSTSHAHKPVNLTDYALMENQLIDLANPDDVYALSVKLPFYAEADDMKTMLTHHIQGKASKREEMLRKTLEIDII